MSHALLVVLTSYWNIFICVTIDYFLLYDITDKIS
jgi:hypothetical protein